jgi:sulfite reductase (NADPH) flavoprotein alpha-component
LYTYCRAADYRLEAYAFTPSQRAWLNGFLAGLFCQTAAAAETAQPAAETKLKLNVLYGSQSGNAESIAKRLAKEAKKQGYDTTIAPLEKASPAALAREKCALIVTSTWGEGDPPDNAAAFWQQLTAENDLKLAGVRLFRSCPGRHQLSGLLRFW